jgi:hypothetical protein
MLKRPSNQNQGNQGKIQKTRNIKKIIKSRRNGAVAFVAQGKVGDTEVIDGVVYTIRSEVQVRDLIREKRYKDAARTCTTFIQNMSDMFKGTPFNEEISHWDTSTCVNFSNMFHNAKKFNRYIGNWDTRNVRYMDGMFDGAERFNQDIGRWDTSSVYDMKRMFAGAKRFNQDIGRWNVVQVSDMRQMFTGASSFNQDLSTWHIRWETLGSGKMDKTMFYGTSMSDARLKTLSMMWEQTFRRAPPRRRQKSYLQDWTTGSYQGVQNARRKAEATLGKDGQRINRYLAQYFRDTPTTSGNKSSIPSARCSASSGPMPIPKSCVIPPFTSISCA